LNTILSAATIEAILNGKFLYEERLSASYSQKVQNAFGMPAMVSPDSAVLSRNIKTVMAQSMAKKLVANDRNVPLFSVDECDQLISEFLDKKFNEEARKEAMSLFCTPSMDDETVEKMVKFALDSGACGVDEEEKKLIKESIKPMINSMVEFVLDMTGESDPYDRFYKIIGTIEFLANKQMLPLDQPLPDELYDEATRRIYSKEEYTALNEKGLILVSDPESLLKTLIKPLVDNLLKDVDPETAAEAREEIEEEMKKHVSAKLNPIFEKLAQVTKEVIAEETNRLYPS